MTGHVLPRALLDAVIDDLSLSIIVLDDRRILYRNTSARALGEKLQRDHHTDLTVLLRDQADAAAAHLRAAGQSGEPRYLWKWRAFIFTSVKWSSMALDGPL